MDKELLIFNNLQNLYNSIKSIRDNLYIIMESIPDQYPGYINYLDNADSFLQDSNTNIKEVLDGYKNIIKK